MIRQDRERMEKILLGQADVLNEVMHILDREQRHDDVLRAMVHSASGHHVNRIARPDPDRVFHVDALREVCMKYRLRFLDASLFKGELPNEAIYRIRQLESRAEGPLRGFKVLAPAARFKLCDSDDDPLLFVPVSEDHYYLVHRWGRDMSPWRGLVAWPFRSVVHLATMVLAAALLLSMVMPNWLITTDVEAGWWGAHRVLFFFWCTMVCASFTVFGWFAFFGSFSREDWNSRHFN